MGHSHLHPMPTGSISAKDERAMRRVTTISVTVALTLVALKSGAWSATNTMSLLSSLADSLFDVVASAINFFAIRYALKPADGEHRYGHNSIEDIAGLAQFAFICGSMLLIVAQSLLRLMQPEPIVRLDIGIGVMAISLLMTIGLYAYQRHVVRQTGSVVVKADSLHYLGDILANASVIASLLIVSFMGWYWADALLAILIAFYIVKEAWEIGEQSFNNLMDREMPDDQKEELEAIIAQTPDIKGVHKLRTRRSGMRVFIEMHIELDKHLSFQEAHAITEALETRILERFSMADVMLHQDPV